MDARRARLARRWGKVEPFKLFKHPCISLWDGETGSTRLLNAGSVLGLRKTHTEVRVGHLLAGQQAGTQAWMLSMRFEEADVAFNDGFQPQLPS